ncbi:MAG TPA: ABC transporter permease [Acidobacteriaceae bacterium]|nr:ABC transporter permease [Acidobacteriaceae bacterium]
MAYRRRFRALFDRARLDAEIQEELQAHIEMRTADNIASGMSPEHARRDALLKFGNPVGMKEQVVAMDAALGMESFFRDVRYAFRQLRKSPGFALTAILTLALGIGGMTAVFSVVESVLLRPLPFQNAGRLVILHESILHDLHQFNVTAPDILTFQRESKAFSGVGGYIGANYVATGAGAPFEAQAERVTAFVFPVLGVSPLLGRTFTQQEDDTSAPVTVLSYALWKDRFQSDPNVLGKTIDLDKRPYTVIGVMPRNFEFPLDAGRFSGRDLWVPMSFTPVEKNRQGDDFDYGAVARLKPGVSIAQAQSDVDRIIAGIQASYPAKYRVQLHGYFRTLKDEVVHNARPLFLILLAAVGLILLIACVNLANLLLVRAATRKQEFGMRMALGAARLTMLRQLLTESLVLSTLGGFTGIAIAVGLVRAAAIYMPDSLPRLNEIAVRWPVFAIAFLLIALTGIACGMAPGLATMRTDPLDALRSGNQSSGQSRSQHSLRSGLVAAEVAMATILLVASGLLLRSFAKMLETNPGFQPQHVLTALLVLPRHDYSSQEKVADFYRQLHAQINALPGVSDMGFSTNIPIVGANSGRLITPQGYVRPAGDGWLITSNYLVEGDYFQTLHIPLIRGRYFDAGDEQSGAPLVTIISQSFADHYFRGKNPIGRHVKVGVLSSPTPWITVVGVVGDIKQAALDQPTVVQMYAPVSQGPADMGPLAAQTYVMGGAMVVVVRTVQDPKAMAAAVEKVVHRLNPLVPVTRVATMEEVVAATESSRRFNTAILTGFATIALLLSLLGIYGVMAYSVVERTREIAIRMALGSTRLAVLLKTLRYALLLTAVGMVAGVMCSLAMTRFLGGLLYGVRPLDGWSIGGATIVLLSCAVFAAWWPARRAASIDPMRALRSE